MSSGDHSQQAARRIVADVLHACHPSRLIEPALNALDWDRPLQVIAIGKASVAMCTGACRVLGPRLTGGICTSALARIAIPAELPQAVSLLHADHPLPSQANIMAADQVEALVRNAAVDGSSVDLLMLISGGGSAHLTLPAAGIELEDLVEVSDLLMKRGATIDELNCVRKHLERLKGGRLAELAWPCRVRAMVLSDVVGDSLDVIASGPCAPDPTTYHDAMAVLERRGIKTPSRVISHLQRGTDGTLPETPKPGHPRLEGVLHQIVGSNKTAVDAAAASAGRLGWTVVRCKTGVTGTAREVGKRLAVEAMELRGRTSGAAAIVWGGETTVDVIGSGKGGRNQELALAAAIELEGIEGVTILSFGTDGIDGPTDAAGACVDGQTIGHGRHHGLDASRSLAESDAYNFLMKARGTEESLLRTGPTGTNVCDVMVALVNPAVATSKAAV